MSGPGWRPGRFLLLATAAVGVGLLVAALFTHAPGERTEQQALADSAEFGLWRSTVAGLTVVGVAVLPVLLHWYRQVVEVAARAEQATGRPPGRRPLLVCVVTLPLVAATAQVLTTQMDLLAWWPARSAVLFALVLALASPAIAAFWLAGSVLRLLRDAPVRPPRQRGGTWAWGPEVVERIKTLVRLRAVLLPLVAVVAVAVSVVTLTTGLLRVAVLATTPDARYPAAAPLLLGGAFAVLLAASYLPAARRFDGVAEQLVEAVLPLPRSGMSRAWVEDREALRTVVPRLDSARDGVEAAIALVAPVLAGLAALLLKT